MKSITFWVAGFVTLASLLPLYQFLRVDSFPVIGAIDISYSQICGEAEITSDSSGWELSSAKMEVPSDIYDLTQMHGEIIYLKNLYLPRDGITRNDYSNFEVSSESDLIVLPSNNGGTKLNEPPCFSLILDQSFEMGAGFHTYEIPSYSFPVWIETSEYKLYLDLPDASSHDVIVNSCEAHCFDMSGLVKVRVLGSSEGIISMALVPVDVEANGYLQQTYECTKKISNSGYFWGRFRCVFDV